MFDDEIFIRYLMYIDQLFSTGYTECPVCAV